MMRLWLLLLLWAAPAVAGVVRAPVRPLRIVLAGAESVPYIKTGGLADVLDPLHRGFSAMGHQTALFLPRYPQITAELQPTGVTVEVPVAGRVERAEVLMDVRGGAPVYFLDNPAMYSEAGPYAPRGSYDDTDERFIFFSRGVVEAVKKLGLRPDVFHVHDWHAALIPALVQRDPELRRAVSVTSIHNIAYQGTFDSPTLEKAGLDPADFRFDKYEYHGRFSLLKAGLVDSDGIGTVSPTYARQIQEDPEFGRGLEGLLRWRSGVVRGFLNRMDKDAGDPASDPHVFQRYGLEDADAGKAANKAELQRRVGLEVRPDAPLFAVISRMDSQKGIDAIAEAVPTLMRLGAQLVVVGLGNGDPKLGERLEELRARHPDRIFLHPFHQVFPRLVYAAADFLLMPSRFEPCGMSQQIAQVYGTLPVVNPTGGLADTVVDAYADAARGNGLHMREFSVEALKDAVARAVALYHAPGELSRLRRVAMSEDRSWAPTLRAYLDFFLELLEKKGWS